MSALKNLILSIIAISLSACVAGKASLPAVHENVPPKSVLELPPDGVQPDTEPGRHFQAALEAYRSGNIDAALAMTRRLSEQHPGTPWYQRSLFLAELAHIKADRVSEADSAMLRVQAEYPELADYAVFYLAEYHFAKMRFTQAAALYQELVERYPASSLVPRSLFQRAQALLESFAYLKASEIFENYLRDNPRSELAPAAGMGLAKALTAEASLDLAVKTYRDIWVRYPGNARDQEVKNALAELKAGGVEIPEPTAADLFERGKNLFRTGSYEKAKETFTTLLEKAPDFPHRSEVLFKIGVSAYHMGKRGESVARLERMVREYPGDPRTAEALTWLGKSYTRINDWEKGIKTYGTIIDRFPGCEWTANALFVTGNIYRETEDVAKAQRFYRRVTEECPESRFADSAIWWRAWLSYSAGDLDKAERVLQELTDRYPRSVLVHQARYWQGRIAEMRSDMSRAASYYQQVLEKGPYSYYGPRAAERIAAIDAFTATVFKMNLPADDIPICGEGPWAADAPPRLAPEAEDAPPVWNEETKRLLAAQPSFRKTFELMQVDMKKEAAAELWSLQEKMPQGRGAHIGFSKAFYELGDYYRSIMLVLRHYERYLDGPGDGVSEDLWRLAYPRGYWESIQAYARKYNQDPYFIAAVIRQESRFQSDAQSPAGARGLMQVMPATGERVARQLQLSGFTSDQLFDSDTIINIGTWYLGHLMKRFKGDPVLAAAAYNAGPEAVAGWVAKNGYGKDRDVFIESIPYTETRGYVKKVLRNYAEYKRIYGAQTPVAEFDLQKEE